MPKRAWGLEISQASIKAVLLEQDKDTLTLVSIDVEELPRGVTDQAQIDAHIRDGFAKLTSRNKLKGQPIACSLPGHTVFNRLVKLPPGDPERIGERVRYEAQQQIPFPLNEVVWDYYLVDRKYGVGEEMEVILFAIKRDVVDHFLGILQEAGLRPQIIQFPPVALYNYLAFDQDIGHASLALDLGAENTDLIVLDGPRCWIRNLPITGSDLTKAIQKGLNIPIAEAEKRKVSPGDPASAQKVYGALQGVYKDLVSEIHRSIGHYKSVSRVGKFDKIFLMGNGAKVINFQKFVSANLQIVATKVSTLSKIGRAGSVDDAKLQKYLPSLGPSLGLALQALDEGRVRINLLPEEERAKREMARRKPIAAAAVVLLALPVYLMWSGVTQEVAAQKAKNVAAKEVEKRREEMAADLSSKKEPIPAYTAELETVSGYIAERDLALKVLGKINGIELFKNNADPNLGNNQERLWILSVEMSEKPPQVPGAATPSGPVGPVIVPWPACVGNVLSLKIEGAIPKRGETTDAHRFVTKTLGDPLKQAFGAELSVIVNPNPVADLIPLSRVKPGGGGGLFGAGADAADKKYWAFTAACQIKVGEEARKPKPPAPAGGPPASGGGSPPK